MMTTQNPLENQHPLLQPLYIRGLEIKNRLFVAPMAHLRYRQVFHCKKFRPYIRFVVAHLWLSICKRHEKTVQVHSQRLQRRQI